MNEKRREIWNSGCKPFPSTVQSGVRNDVLFFHISYQDTQVFEFIAKEGLCHSWRKVSYFGVGVWTYVVVCHYVLLVRVSMGHRLWWFNVITNCPSHSTVTIFWSRRRCAKSIQGIQLSWYSQYTVCLSEYPGSLPLLIALFLGPHLPARACLPKAWHYFWI